MKPRVSVIIPIYNAQNYLEQCIDSVVNQTVKNIEIILVDDESTDDSGKMCDEWRKRDSRINVVHIKKSGVSNARNKGIQLANSKYIMFVDSDDWIKNTMVDVLLNKIDNSKADVVFCDYINVQGTRKINCEKVIDYKLYQKAEIPYVIRNMFGGGKYFSSVWRGVYRKEIIDKNNIIFSNMKFAEDMLFNIEFLINCNCVDVIENKLYYYRENLGSSLQRLKNNLEEMQKLPNNIFRIFEKYEKTAYYNFEIENEIQIAIERIFNINYRYNSFKSNMIKLRDNYSNMFIKISKKNNKVQLCNNKQWLKLYITLILEKADRKLRKRANNETKNK
jgi:glycosyltransferase involved in cell wall biosynthesis